MKAAARLVLGNTRDLLSPESSRLPASPIVGDPRLRILGYYRDLQDLYRRFGSDRHAQCGRKLRPHTREVEVRRNPGGRAHFHGTVRCALLWECAPCQAKIKTARGQQVHKAVLAHTERHGPATSSLVTLTIAHGFGDDLKRLREGQTRAWRRLSQSHDARAAFRELGLTASQRNLPGIDAPGDHGGWIRALEVTDGPNGWHPHQHLVALTTQPLLPRCGRVQGRWRCPLCRQDRGRARFRQPPLCSDCPGSRFRRWLVQAWRAAVHRELGPKHVPSVEHAVSIVPADRSGHYLAALGLEIAAPGTKQAHPGHRTPLDLLHAAIHDGDVAALERYQQFTRDMKGAKQLFWSRGLKARYHVEDLTDEEIMARADAEGELVARIKLEHFRIVRRTPGALTDILEAAETAGALAVYEYVRLMVARWRAKQLHDGGEACAA